MKTKITRSDTTLITLAVLPLLLIVYHAISFTKLPVIQTVSTAGWKTLSDPVAKFTIMVPSNWSVSQQITPPGHTAGENNGGIDFSNQPGAWREDNPSSLGLLLIAGDGYSSYLEPANKLVASGTAKLDNVKVYEDYFKDTTAASNPTSPITQGIVYTFKHDNYYFVLTLMCPTSDTNLLRTYYTIGQSLRFSD
jgi:hypothetical protein